MIIACTFFEEFKLRRGDNAWITTKVKEASFDDAPLKVIQIHVDTYKDMVQLNAYVDRKPESATRADVASKVAGVKSVKNDR